MHLALNLTSTRNSLSRSVLSSDLNPAMATQPNAAPKVVFGPFEYDDLSGDLSKYGTSLRLQGKPLKILSFLVNRPGQIISRDELQRHLWKGTTFVDFEQGVNFAVKQVREALGDRAENSIYVETVPKRGYRFLAPVVVPGRDETQEVRMTAEPFLQRSLGENIVELRLSEEQHRKQLRTMRIAIVCLAIACVVLFFLKT